MSSLVLSLCTLALAFAAELEISTVAEVTLDTADQDGIVEAFRQVFAAASNADVTAVNVTWSNYIVDTMYILATVTWPSEAEAASARALVQGRSVRDMDATIAGFLAGDGIDAEVKVKALTAELAGRACDCGGNITVDVKALEPLCLSAACPTGSCCEPAAEEGDEEESGAPVALIVSLSVVGALLLAGFLGVLVPYWRRANRKSAGPTLDEYMQQKKEESQSAQAAGDLNQTVGAQSGDAKLHVASAPEPAIDIYDVNQDMPQEPETRF